MYIHEAIRARTAERPFITRKRWVDDYGSYSHLSVKLLPTDTPDCCVLESKLSKNPCRGWQPMAGDLLADDWIITD